MAAGFVEDTQCIVAVVAELGSFAAVPDQDILCTGVEADLHQNLSAAACCSQTVECYSVVAGLAGNTIVHIAEDPDGHCCRLPNRNLMLNTFDTAEGKGIRCKAEMLKSLSSIGELLCP